MRAEHYLIGRHITANSVAELALCRIELCTDPTRVMVGHQKRRCIGRRGRLLAQRRPDCSSALTVNISAVSNYV